MDENCQSVLPVQTLTGDKQVRGLPPKYRGRVSLIMKQPTQLIPMFDIRHPLSYRPAVFAPVAIPQ